MVKADALDWSKCKVDEKASEVVLAWKHSPKKENYPEYWIAGQLDEQGQPHGLARVVINDEAYEGSFVHGWLHGYGREIRRDHYHVGEYNNGTRCGPGKEVDVTGTYEGTFDEDGGLQGPGKWTSRKGNVYEGVWSKDYQLNGVDCWDLE